MKMNLQSLLLLLPFSAIALGQAHEARSNSHRLPLTEQQRQEFLALLGALPSDSINAALHSHLAHFKDGVFDHDRKALEKVHDDNPALATQLLSAAAFEELKRSLAKRQTPQNTSDPVPTTTDVPPEPTDTDEPPPPDTTSDEPPPPDTTTKDDEPTTTDDPPPPTTTEEAPPPVTTDDQVTNTPEPTYTPRPTDEGSTFVTDTVPSDSALPSSVVFVTSLPDGGVQTVTSVEVVDGTATRGGDDQDSATGTQPPPGLQTGAASILSSPWAVEGLALVGCAALFTFFL